MRCTKCGFHVDDDATTCRICGTAVNNAPPLQNNNGVPNIMSPNPMEQNNQPMNSNNGFQIEAFSKQQKVNNSFDPSNIMNTQNMPSNDLFSSPKVVAGQGNMQQIDPNPQIYQQPMYQPQSNYDNQTRENNGGFKFNMNILIVVCAVIFLGFVGVFSFKYFEKIEAEKKLKQEQELQKEVESNITDYEEQQKKKMELMKKNVTLAEENKLYDGSILFTYENNNNLVVSVALEIEFYDANNQFLGSVKEYAYPAPYSKFLVKIGALSVKQGYTSYKVNLTVNDYDLIPVTIDTNKIMINDNGEAILVQYNNSTGDTIDNMELCILYYNGEKINGAECSSVQSTPAGNNANFEFEYYYANKNEGLIFDTYRFAVSAYNKPKND